MLLLCYAAVLINFTYYTHAKDLYLNLTVLLEYILLKTIIIIIMVSFLLESLLIFWLTLFIMLGVYMLDDQNYAGIIIAEF